MVALFQQDSRADAFSFNSGSTVSFDVVTRMSPKQDALVRGKEQTADFAYSFVDNRAQSATQTLGAVNPNQVQAGMPSIGTTSIA